MPVCFDTSVKKDKFLVDHDPNLLYTKPSRVILLATSCAVSQFRRQQYEFPRHGGEIRLEKKKIPLFTKA